MVYNPFKLIIVQAARNIFGPYRYTSRYSSYGTFFGQFQP